MTELERLQSGREDIQRHRKERGCVRAIQKAGPTDFNMAAEQYLTAAIDELWDLISDVATRKCDEAIRDKAEQMRREAERALWQN